MKDLPDCPAVERLRTHVLTGHVEVAVRTPSGAPRVADDPAAGVEPEPARPEVVAPAVDGVVPVDPARCAFPPSVRADIPERVVDGEPVGEREPLVQTGAHRCLVAVLDRQVLQYPVLRGPPVRHHWFRSER